MNEPALLPEPSRRPLGIAAGVLVAACAFSFWFAHHSGSFRRPNAGLVVTAQHLNFGEVWEDDRFCWTLPIHNPTAREVNILRFGESCTCASTDPPSLRIPAGQTGRVKMHLNLTQGGPRDVSRRDFSVHVYPLIEGSVVQQEGWALQGVVKTAFTLAPLAVKFDQPLVRGEPMPTQTVMLRSHVPLSNAEVACIPPVASIRVEPRDARTFALAITPRPDAPAGPFLARATVHAILPEGKLRTGKSFTIEGRMCEQVTLDESVISLGPRPVGTPVEATVRLRSLNGKPFTVAKIDPGSKEVQVEPVETHGYRIRQTVTRPGHHEQRVVFHIDVAEADSFPLSLSILHHGIAPRAED